eukprot:NODE_833_length_1615_cov_68.784946_g823_i0.p1 GENE.NODE_833_length_1615_cov_68.784946_g823_i0~~NODE_833_length_1615_cov_68.784946_g823_i0.p1  ORF type:complete len:497 (+),score=91.74 NODE_833_length_1615_cov_68.784946_g823_i0:56-1546(+)
MLRLFLRVAVVCALCSVVVAEEQRKSSPLRPVLFAALVFAICVAVTLWLPPMVVRIRMWLFTSLNDGQGVQFPNEQVNGRLFKQLYSSKNCDLRSNCGLSDFFFYHLSPGPELHQEQVEPGPQYDMFSLATKKLLAASNKELAQLAQKYGEDLLQAKNVRPFTVTRLKDFWFPMFAKFYYEMIFKEEPPEELVPLLIGSGMDVLASLKCVKLRNMKIRNALTQHLMDKLNEGACADIFPDEMTVEQRALHLQGVFFHTGCVQMSEAMAHTLIAIGQHPHVEEKLLEDTTGQYLELVISESLRLYPLFGIAHRILSGNIELEDGTVYTAGTVFCFNYPDFQTSGYEYPNDFIPERWEVISKSEVNYIPFGVAANRPCPGQRLALVIMRELVKVSVRRCRWHSPIVHSRSLPDGGLCLVADRTHSNGKKRPAMLVAMKAWEKLCVVARSVAQLGFGYYMLRQAQKLRLATRMYDEGAVNHKFAAYPLRPTHLIKARRD